MPQDLFDYLLSIGVTFAAGAALSAIVFQAWGAHWKARAMRAENTLVATIQAFAEDPAQPPVQHWPYWRPEFAEYLKRAKEGSPLPFKSLEELIAFCDENCS